MAELSGKGQRSVLAAILAYALVLQGFIAAADIGRTATAAIPGAALADFELCSHGGKTGAPSQYPPGDSHCPFCIAGAAYVDCAPPGAPRYSAVILGDPVWPLKLAQLAGFLINLNAWPRGPPSAA